MDAKSAVILSIEHDQRIDLTSDGQIVRGHETYIREYDGMIGSGLMARMSNAGYKVLHALALRARILGDSRREGAKEEFRELEELGIVSDDDKGQLFCFPSREQLLKDTGMGSVHTIDTALDELVELGLVRRITVSQPRRGRGFFGSNVYLIHPGSFIGKFGTASGEQKVLPVAEMDGEPKLLAAKGTESSSRNTANRALKRQELSTTTTREVQAQIERIVEFFSLGNGAKSSEVSEKEVRQLVALLEDGFLEEQIRDGIARAIAHAQKRGRKASFSFCLRSVRHFCPGQREIVTDSGKSSTGEIVTPEGKSYAPIVPAFGQSYAPLLQGLGLDERNQADMEALLMLVSEHSDRALSKTDARRWKALADEFVALAQGRGITAVALVRQAVEEAFDAGSTREGYCAPKLARSILSRWSNDKKGGSRKKGTAPLREVPPAVQVYREVRRRFPAQELWEPIAATVGTEERSLAFWQQILTTWVARGYNPLNVEGPLQWFRARSIPLRDGPLGPAGSDGTGPVVPLNGNGGGAQAPVQTRRPIEKLEVIQERLRQNMLGGPMTAPILVSDSEPGVALARETHDAALSSETHDAALSSETHDAALSSETHDAAVSGGIHDAAVSGGIHDAALSSGIHDAALSSGIHDPALSSGIELSGESA